MALISTGAMLNSYDTSHGENESKQTRGQGRGKKREPCTLIWHALPLFEVVVCPGHGRAQRRD